MKPVDEIPVGQFPDDGTVDSEFLNQLATEAIEYIHEDAKDEVLSVITNTDNTANAIGATAYKITRGLIERHKPAAMSLEADMSHATALATEVVDMLVEVAEAAQPEAVADVDKIREEALLRAVVMHGEEAETTMDEDQKEEAQMIYGRMMTDGTADEGLAYVNQRSKELGLNSNDWTRQGTELGTGFAQGMIDKAVKKPLEQGVQQGVQNMEKQVQAAPEMAQAPAAQPPMEQPPMEQPPADPNAPLMGGM